MSIYTKKFNKKIFEDKNSSIYKILNLIDSKPKRILDVGCASGYFGAFLKEKYNSKVWGIEIDKKDFKIAARQLDKVFNIDIEDEKQLSKIKTKFDTIIFADVLEHLKNPSACLKNFYKKLNSNGEIIASIPNIVNYYTKLMLFNNKWEYKDFGLMDRTHKTFFNYNNIVNLFEESGFYIYQIDYTSSNVSPLILMDMLIKSGININQTIINNFFSIESNIFQYIIKAKPIKPNNYKSYLENKKKLISKLFISTNKKLNFIKKIKNQILIELIEENKNLKNELNNIKSAKTYIYWQKFNKIKKKIFKNEN